MARTTNIRMATVTMKTMKGKPNADDAGRKIGGMEIATRTTAVKMTKALAHLLQGIHEQTKPNVK